MKLKQNGDTLEKYQPVGGKGLQQNLFIHTLPQTT